MRQPGAPLYASYARQYLMPHEERHSPGLPAIAAASLLGGAFSGAGRVSARRRAGAQERLGKALKGNQTAADEIRYYAGLGYAGYAEALATLEEYERPAREKAAGERQVAQEREERAFGLAGEIGTALARGRGGMRGGRRRRRSYYEDEYEPRPRRGGARGPSVADVTSGAGLVKGGAGLATGVGAASGAAIAAVVIGGLAVGAAIGTALRYAFGEARAVRAEEAADKAGSAMRRVRGETERRLGRSLTSAEARKFYNSYIANLQQLGFTQDAQGRWSRERSWLERTLG